MSDAKPNYAVERLRLELGREQHLQTIERGRGRLAEIERQIKVNLMEVEVRNAELRDETARITENETALQGRIAEIDANLKAMVKEPSHG